MALDIAKIRSRLPMATPSKIIGFTIIWDPIREAACFVRTKITGKLARSVISRTNSGKSSTRVKIQIP